MEESGFKESLSAKVDVSVRLGQVFEKEELDFVLFFSSMQSFSKAPGQSNYAAGCVFKDTFAHQLGNEWSCPVKVINWGYWGSVGIASSEKYRDRFIKNGIESIEFPEAMKTLEALISGTKNQIGLIKTSKPLDLESLNHEEKLKEIKNIKKDRIKFFQQEKSISNHMVEDFIRTIVRENIANILKRFKPGK